MKRMGFVLGIKADQIAEYKRIHAAVWPEVLATIARCNIKNYTIFLKEPENLLFAYFEYHGTDFKADMAKMAADPATQEGQSTAGHVTAFTMSFAAGSGSDLTINATLTHDVNGGGTVTKASSFVAPATGFPAQLRSNDGDLVYAGLFGGASAERVVVAISKPVHAALSLKKK